MELGSYKQIFFSNNKSVWLGNGKYGCQQYFLTHVSKKKKKKERLSFINQTVLLSFVESNNTFELSKTALYVVKNML